MADWSASWDPKFISFSPVWRTKVTDYEGPSQYASLRDTPGYKFRLDFDPAHLTKDVLYAMRAFFNARKGMYEAFTFPNFAEQIKGSTLAVVAGSLTITDSGSGILNAGFRAGGKVTIAGSGAGNNGVYSVHATTAPTTGVLTLAAGSGVSNESGNAKLRIYNTYNVHFMADELWQQNAKRDLGVFETIELYAEPY